MVDALAFLIEWLAAHVRWTALRVVNVRIWTKDIRPCNVRYQNVVVFIAISIVWKEFFGYILHPLCVLVSKVGNVGSGVDIGS